MHFVLWYFSSNPVLLYFVTHVGHGELFQLAPMSTSLFLWAFCRLFGCLNPSSLIVVVIFVCFFLVCS